MLRKISLRYLFIGCVLGFLSFSGYAATIVVNNVLDPDNTPGSCAKGGSCSIRQAINAAASGDTVTFNIPPANCPSGVCTLNLSLGGLTIDESLTIEGTGARNLIIRRADGTNPTMFTILNIVATGSITVDVSGVGISNGSSMASSGGIYISTLAHLRLNSVSVTESVGSAGGIYNAGNLTMLNSTVANNAGQTGGIANADGVMSIANSTISSNRGFGIGLAGGISNGTVANSPAILNLNNVTISNNIQEADDILTAGGVKNFGTANTRNTIFAGNTCEVGIADDVRGVFISQGGNFLGNFAGSNGIGFPGSGDIVGVPAFLSLLSNFGGQTNTHALPSGVPVISPAIDRGATCVVTATCAVNNPPVALIYDQRGAPYTRNWGSTVDMGAFEYQIEPFFPDGVVGGRVFASSGHGLSKARVTLTEENGQSHTFLTNGLGYYRFTDISPGQTVILSVVSKTAQYTPQEISVIHATPDTYFIP